MQNTSCTQSAATSRLRTMPMQKSCRASPQRLGPAVIGKSTDPGQTGQFFAPPKCVTDPRTPALTYVAEPMATESGATRKDKNHVHISFLTKRGAGRGH